MYELIKYLSYFFLIDDSDQDHHSSKPGKCLLLRTSRIDGISSGYSQRRSYSSNGIIDEKSSQVDHSDRRKRL